MSIKLQRTCILSDDFVDPAFSGTYSIRSVCARHAVGTSGAPMYSENLRRLGCNGKILESRSRFRKTSCEAVARFHRSASVILDVNVRDSDLITMSALVHFADSSRTSLEVREVP